uniref:Pancreatic trypsin inhibitor n=1 Tax=Rhipicephalus zambeziensis TaxID=60191 RepID=A0A224Y2B1_9ACAR
MKVLFRSCILLLLSFTYAGHGTTPPRCLKPPALGICRPFYKVFYFDYTEYKCRKLKKGLCIGGTNHFPSQMTCQNTCIKAAKPKPVCSVEPRTSWWLCLLRKKHWYFDARTNTCHQSERKKCGKGDNRFSSFEECMERCSYVGCQKCKNGIPYYYPNGTTPCGAEPE